jgi:hypothetical protein
MLIESFETYVRILINDKGIHPAPMATEVGKFTELHSLDLPREQCWQYFFSKTLDARVTAAVFGLDRSTRPGQGTEFAGVLTCVSYVKAVEQIWGFRARDQFRFGVINYQHAPRIVRPIDWKNLFWIEQLRREFFHCLPWR